MWPREPEESSGHQQEDQIWRQYSAGAPEIECRPVSAGQLTRPAPVPGKNLGFHVAALGRQRPFPILKPKQNSRYEIPAHHKEEIRPAPQQPDSTGMEHKNHESRDGPKPIELMYASHCVVLS